MHGNKIRKSLMLIGALAMGSAMSAAHATTYQVTETFNQVVYNTSHPSWDTIFTGTFNYDAASQTVSDLTGSLTQAMGGNANARNLSFQLSSVYDATLGGLIVTTFYQNSTDVFTNSGGVAGTNGFAPAGTKTFGNQNAYATIFVNLTDPTAALTAAQIDKLAYADCTTGGLMGSTCMTGWVNHAKANLAGGTMQGTYPITQSITAAVPEPESYAMFLAGLGLLGLIARRRRAA